MILGLESICFWFLSRYSITPDSLDNVILYVYQEQDA